MNKRVAPKPKFANLTDDDVRLAIEDALSQTYDPLLAPGGPKPARIEDLDGAMLKIQEECTRLMQAYLDDPEALDARGPTAVESFAARMYERWHDNKKFFGERWGNWDSPPK